MKHGEEECKLNAIGACAIKTWPNPVITNKNITSIISTVFKIYTTQMISEFEMGWFLDHRKCTTGS